MRRGFLTGSSPNRAFITERVARLELVPQGLEGPYATITPHPQTHSEEWRTLPVVFRVVLVDLHYVVEDNDDQI